MYNLEFFRVELARLTKRVLSLELGGGVRLWGSITGTLSDQADLWAALTWNVRAISADDTAEAGDMCEVDASLGDVVLTLQSAALCQGKEIIVSKADSTSNYVAVTAFAGDTINSDDVVLLTAQDASITIVSTGSGWRIK